VFNEGYLRITIKCVQIKGFVTNKRVRMVRMSLLNHQIGDAV